MTQAKIHKVLVVDDDSILRLMLKSILDDSGEYSVVGMATNGTDAVLKYTLLRPDLVLLDINLPKMDGLQVLEEIRKMNPFAKVLMVSSDATLDRVKGAIQKGAAGFIVKPLSAASVMGKVRACFR